MCIRDSHTVGEGTDVPFEARKGLQLGLKSQPSLVIFRAVDDNNSKYIINVPFVTLEIGEEECGDKSQLVDTKGCLGIGRGWGELHSCAVFLEHTGITKSHHVVSHKDLKARYNSFPSEGWVWVRGIRFRLY